MLFGCFQSMSLQTNKSIYILYKLYFISTDIYIWIYLWLSHREGKSSKLAMYFDIMIHGVFHTDYFWRTDRKASRSTYTQTIIFFLAHSIRLYLDFILDKQFGRFNRVVAPWVYFIRYNIIHFYSETLKNYSRFYEHTICANIHTYTHGQICIYANVLKQALNQFTFFALYFDVYSTNDVYGSLNLQKRLYLKRPIRDHRDGFEAYAISLIILFIQSHFTRFYLFFVFNRMEFKWLNIYPNIYMPFSIQ